MTHEVSIIRKFEPLPSAGQLRNQIINQRVRDTPMWHKPIRDWCRENCSGKWSLRTDITLVTGVFETVDDAVLFKLRWC